MLSPIVYRLLAKPKVCDTYTMRTFMFLMAEHDLREFTVIDLAPIVAMFICKPDWVRTRIEKLVSLGILERGPKVAGNRVRVPTYRIRRQFLLSDTALKRHYQDLRDRQEREILLT